MIRLVHLRKLDLELRGTRALKKELHRLGKPLHSFHGRSWVRREKELFSQSTMREHLENVLKK